MREGYIKLFDPVSCGIWGVVNVQYPKYNLDLKDLMYLDVGDLPTWNVFQILPVKTRGLLL